jgi:hypothetical protein
VLLLEEDVILAPELPAVLERLTPALLARFDVVRLSRLMKQVGNPL